LLPGDESLIGGGIVWTEVGWIVWNRSKKGGFGKSEILGGFLEIGLCGTFYTITAAALWRHG